MCKFTHLCLVVLLFSCGLSSKTDLSEEKNKEDNIVKYAERFKIDEFDGYHTMTINEPWQGSDHQDIVYLLYENDIPENVSLEEYIPIKYPVNRVVSNSTTHLSFFEILGVEDKLVGFSQGQFIYSNQITSNLQAGKTKEVGANGTLDIESVLSLEADIVLAFVARGENKKLNKLNELGETIVFTPDYLETSVLGRAEWIKFVGYLTGQKKISESYFDHVVSKYDSLVNMIQDVKNPSVFSGNLYGGTWYMPAGKNYNSLMIQEAGGNYLWSENLQNGWLNMDFEAVYAKAHDAEFWIGVGNFNTLNDLVKSDERYEGFEACKNGNVYSYTNRMAKNGGNDYFESGNANPHLLLADHIKILHPELLPNYELYYYKKLE